MAKVYMLTEEDFRLLTDSIDRDPRWGTQGGSSAVFNEVERLAHDDAHRFYNYQVRVWIDRMKQ
jgi:hypothetical protein